MNAVQPQEKDVPKILLEFLLYGLEENKLKITKALDELQLQQQKSRAASHRMRILWYIDKGEKTSEEKKKWLLEHKKCKYYKFIELPYLIPKNLVKDCMQKIRVCENSIKSMKKFGIEVSRVTKEAPIYAEVID